MILELITLGFAGAYVTGDEQRKAKMRKIGSDLIEVVKDTAADAADKSKGILDKMKSKYAD